ncbi:nitroreductase [Acetobacterium paludosum]|uniref:Nitroreductase n=1 Tax=Acetobacterium paludosum TaxID=52693 RepID=A0A923HV98_9FIRM|nr:nitroreductase family protein [Acetobacterium paludosum]MBC3887817.1 nitroreductase [Acetobacterium paludosum]
METMKAIAKRKSSRVFKAQQITETELTTILQAANAAPVGMGQFESVKLTVIQNKALLEKIDEAVAALFAKTGTHPTYGAPTVILVSGAELKGPMSGVPYCNAAVIIENMAVAAADLGLGSCYLMGIIAAISIDMALCAELKVPQGFVPCSAIALGYATEELTEKELTTGKLAMERIN